MGPGRRFRDHDHAERDQSNSTPARRRNIFVQEELAEDRSESVGTGGHGHDVAQISPGEHGQLRDHPYNHQDQTADEPTVGQDGSGVAKESIRPERRHGVQTLGDKQIPQAIGNDEQRDENWVPEL